MFEIFCSNKIKLLILLLLFIIYFIENYDRYSIAVSPIPYINYSSYEYSILTGPAFTIVYTLSGLIIAIECSDSFLSISKYLVLSIGTFIFSVAFLTTAIATTFWQQIIIRVVIGISQSIVTPFSTSIISEIFPTELLGSAFGIYNSGTYFAFALSLSLGTYIYQNFGWQAGYILFGLIGIGVAVVIPCFRRYLNGNYSQNYSRLSTDSSHNGSNPSVIHCETITPFSSISIYSVNSVESSSATSGTIEQELKRVSKSSFHRFFMVVHEIFWINWGKHSYIYLLCLATGLRLGGGYIWAAYTSVFFSELFVDEENGSKCYYSHNSDYTDSYTGVCGKSYPYCVDSSCVKLSESPWHNQVQTLHGIINWWKLPLLTPSNYSRG